MITTVLLLLLLLLLSGFFSGAEIALFSIGPARVQAMVDEGRKGAGALRDLKQQPERLLITILVGNNIANIAAASVATYTATQMVGSAGVGIATGVMTLLVLFFGEVTPKSLATRHAVGASLILAPLLLWLTRITRPIVAPIEWLVGLILPRGAAAPRRPTEQEIRSMSNLGLQAGSIDEHEVQLIESAFALDQRRAWEVMTPRVDVFAWSDAMPLVAIASELPRVPYSRIPVFGDSPDDVTGVLYIRDAYQALVAGEQAIPLKELAREPFFVPFSLPLIELLEQFRKRRIHMGLVVDEHGGIDGLVTLEDILEELVGEIVDETDVPEESIVRINRNEILVDGATDLREINDFFHTSFPRLEHRSLNGYLLENLGRVPEEGERIEREGVAIEVLRATETQVTRVRLSRLKPQHADDAEVREDEGAVG